MAPFNERLNREIKRRSKAIGIFPNCESILRRVGSLLCEINEVWQVNKRKCFFVSAKEELKTKEPALRKIAKRQLELAQAA